VSEEGVDLGLGHIGGVTDAVEAHEALDPLALRLLGAAVVRERRAERIWFISSDIGRLLHGSFQCGGHRQEFNG